MGDKNITKKKRGGFREGAGRHSLYGKGLEMKAMKIPVVAQDAVKELLKSIDWTQFEKKDKKRNDEDFIHEKERLKWEDEIER